MVILTDLSDVLTRGINGIGDVIAKYYDRATAKRAWKRYLETELLFRELMRGKISEDDYWRFYLSDGAWPCGLEEIKSIFSENLEKTVPGTLDVYRRITAYPNSSIDPDGPKQKGRPEIYIVSDHIHERLDELHAYHPDVFEIASKEFWSCEIGQIKMDNGFFGQLLRSLDLPRNEVIFIDDNANNTTAAALEGIASIRFENATQLETVLKEYGFRFAPKSP